MPRPPRRTAPRATTSPCRCSSWSITSRGGDDNLKCLAGDAGSLPMRMKLAAEAPTVIGLTVQNYHPLQARAAAAPQRMWQGKPMAPATHADPAFQSQAASSNDVRHAMTPVTTCAGSTPVSLKSSPCARYVKRSWSMPSRRSTVAWKSRTCTGSFTTL